MYLTQPLDHRHPEKGSFRQRVIVGHVGYDRPTVIVTEGYGAGYALRPTYREELSELFDANMIFVEHRYFLESTPEPCDWQYLTAENSAEDLHAVTTAFKTLYLANGSVRGSARVGRPPYYTVFSSPTMWMFPCLMLLLFVMRVKTVGTNLSSAG